MPFVLYSETNGVYLGSFIGLGFWSKLDPAGHTVACIFNNERDYKIWRQSLGNPDNDARLVPVVTARDDCATVAECVAAGLPGWDPQIGVLPKEEKKKKPATRRKG